MEKIYNVSNKCKRAGVPILISRKADTKLKSITEEGNFIMMNMSLFRKIYQS